MTKATNQFDLSAANWDEKPERVENALKITQAVIEAVKPDSTITVMEYGCGTGISCIKMAELVAHITAIDTSAGMLEKVQEKVSDLKLTNVDTALLDLSHPAEKPAGSYDLIYSMMTLHHIEDIDALFDSFHRSLNNGGKIALIDLKEEDGGFHLQHDHVAHFGFKPEELAEKLVATGFSNVTCLDLHAIPRFNEDGSHRGDYPLFLSIAEKNDRNA